MYMTFTFLRDGAVLVAGYDEDADPYWEFCAIFQSLAEEKRVRLIERHRRDHTNPELCETMEKMSSDDLKRFDAAMPKFYGVAMKAFGFKPFDDSLPYVQVELPLGGSSDAGPQK